MSKIISIVLPTYNGRNVLPYTLSVLKEQVLRNSECVELIVCNNASTDGTDEWLREEIRDNSWFTYISYDIHVDGGESIERSAENASGKYILFWGDDDVPGPMMVDILLEYTSKFPNVGCFHFSWLRGIDLGDGILRNLVVGKNSYEKEYIEYDSKEFIDKFYMSMNFMSAELFLREAWIKGGEYDNTKSFGFQFLSRILHGISGYPGLFISYPLCIQRSPIVKRWQSRSVYYCYIGIPNMLKELEKNGVIDNWRVLWDRLNSTSYFMHVVPQITLDKKFYKNYLGEIKNNLFSIWKKWTVDFFYYFVPKWVYSSLRNLVFKNGK